MLFKTHLPKLTLLITLALIQTGCSISASVESSSESISTSLESIASISTSSSGSSENQEEKVEETGNLYEEDIAALTVLYITRGKSDDEFKRQITTTAQNHGMNDWEQDDATYKAMGKGLKRAGISKGTIKTISYFQKMTSKAHYNLVLEGFNN